MITTFVTKCSVIWVISLLLYLLLFRNKSLFHTNRVFLLGSLIAGLVFPIIHQMQWLTLSSTAPLSHFIATQHTSLNSIYELTSFIPINPSANSETKFQLDLKLIYLLGFIITAIRFLLGLWNIRKIHLAGKSKILKGLKLIVHDMDKLPFSFFTTIYLHQNLLHHTSILSILNHERAHIKGRHSIDIIITEILKVLLWFHPLVYLYKILITEAHEFIADAQACLSENKNKYCLKLVEPSLAATAISMGNNFFTNKLKKRIDMISKKTTSNHLSYYIILPLFLSALLLWSCSNKDERQATKYEVGAVLEIILEQHYYNTDSVTSHYLELIESYPDHLLYIQNRIQEHFENLGGEILFDQKEIEEELDKLDFFNSSQGFESRSSFFIKASGMGTKPSSLPILQPIRKSDLKKKIIPTHPTNKDIIHNGIDYIADHGTPVLASGDGVVNSISTYQKGFGNCIRIDHNNDMETFYAHLSEILITKGDHVKKGMIIGKVGHSGQASSPHLHFELLRDGQQWDLKVISQVVD